MTDITIYKVDGTSLIVAPITKDATIKKVLMGDWYIEIPFTLSSELPIPKGSYIVYDSQKFEIMDNVYPEWQSSTGGYKYVLKFWSQQNHFKRCKVFYGRSIAFASRIANEMERLANSNIRIVLTPTYASSEVTFHDTATVRDFAKLIVDNICNFLRTNNWEVGKIPSELDININPETARRELISFDGTSCWDAVNQIAQTFEIEWWTNVNATTGKVYLNFGTCKFNTPIDFKQGEIINSIPAKKGDTSEYGTRFFVYGGTQNLAPDYRKAENEGGVTNHISEKRLCMRDDDGNYVDFIDVRPNLTPAEIVEQVVKFDDVFPKSEETITEVSTVDRKYNGGGDNGEDTTFKAFVVTCADTAYTEELLMKGETLGCKFTSGYLNGREFELSTEKVGDKQFEIIHTTETDGNGGTIILPNEAMCPRIGDTFILTGISLPEKNVKEAENEVFHKGLEYAEKNSSDTDVYDCPTNPVYCTENDCNYNVGQAVKLYSTRFKDGYRESRIQGYSKKLYNEYIATYTIGDNSSYSLISAIAKQIESSEISSKEYADNIVRKAEKTSNRRYTSAKQTAQALAEANLEYFTEAINPVAVQTMQLIAGSDAQQFDLIFPEGGGISYSKATGEISASSASLHHYTVGNSEIESVITFTEDNTKGIWQIDDDFSAKLDDATKHYWLYIKANKSDNTGEYILSESTFPLGNGDGYYYFLVGLFNAENSEGDRYLTKLYGFTEITPGRVVTEKIQSADAKTWIDLKNGAASFAGGKIKWDDKGNATIQNLEMNNLTASSITVEDSLIQRISAKDSTFENVTVKGSISSPFESFDGTSILVYDVNNDEYVVFSRDATIDQKGSILWYAWRIDNEIIYSKADAKIEEGFHQFYKVDAQTKLPYEIDYYIVSSYRNKIAGHNGIDKNDNLAIALGTGKIHFGADELDWSPANSGRLIRLVNAPYSGVTPTEPVVLRAPDNAYFFEDGEKYSRIWFSNEVLEMIGYGTSTEFYGWIILNRKDVATTNSHGYKQPVLFQGEIVDNVLTKFFDTHILNTGETPLINMSQHTGEFHISTNYYRGLEDPDEWTVITSGATLKSKAFKKDYEFDGGGVHDAIYFNLDYSNDTIVTFQVISTRLWRSTHRVE